MVKNILIAIIFFYSITSAQPIYDLIQPLNLLQDQTTKILISDIFYSSSYDVEFASTKNVSVSYDTKTKEVSFTPHKDFSGIELISFKLGDETFQIPVKLTKSKKYLFTYTPQPGEKQINLFGQFNSWNRQELELKDINNDGTLEIEVPLDPGRYEYKYFVDGKEVVDPVNPVKVPNGMGDYNSLLVIDESGKDKMFLHILG